MESRNNNDEDRVDFAKRERCLVIEQPVIYCSFFSLVLWIDMYSYLVQNYETYSYVENCVTKEQRYDCSSRT